MKRFLSIWLPRWPVRRRFARPRPQDGSAPPADDGAALVLSTTSESGQRITATNAAAEALGLHAGMALADARAMHPALRVEAADPEGDRAALGALALWCQGYSPYTRPDLPDGLALDITGCAHLFGGEAALLEELERRLERFGLKARLAIAPTLGAAWAMARHGPSPRTILQAGPLHDHLAPLPLSALRLEGEIVAALGKLGLKRIGDLLGKPRAPLAARFGPELLRRLDQALGREDESFCAVAPPPRYRAARRFAEPLVELAHVEWAIRQLAADLAGKLERAGRGARRLELTLFRLDGGVERLDVLTSTLTRDADHLARLLCERAADIPDHDGFGFEAALLSAYRVEKAKLHQPSLHARGEEQEDDLACLLDRLVNRFGSRNVTRFAPRASYIPERAARAVPVLRNTLSHDWRAHLHAQNAAPFARPLLLFATPEPVTALFEVPDNPPVRFEWRRVSHRVTRADGPERIAPEWWRAGPGEHPQTRDYYRVEDEAGRRYWLYREGLHEREDDSPRWFIHGVFP